MAVIVQMAYDNARASGWHTRETNLCCRQYAKMGVDAIDGASWNRRHVARKFANNYDDPGHPPRPTANR